MSVCGRPQSAHTPASVCTVQPHVITFPRTPRFIQPGLRLRYRLCIHNNGRGGGASVKPAPPGETTKTCGATFREERAQAEESDPI